MSCRESCPPSCTLCSRRNEPLCFLNILAHSPLQAFTQAVLSAWIPPTLHLGSIPVIYSDHRIENDDPLHNLGLYLYYITSVIWLAFHLLHSCSLLSCESVHVLLVFLSSSSNLCYLAQCNMFMDIKCLSYQIKKNTLQSNPIQFSSIQFSSIQCLYIRYFLYKV